MPTDGGMDDMFGGGDANAAPAGGDDIFGGGDSGLTGNGDLMGDGGLMGDRCVSPHVRGRHSVGQICENPIVL